MRGKLDHGKFVCCRRRMIAFLAGCLSINMKRTVLARPSVRPTGFVANRWRFWSKLVASASISILVEHLRNCRPMNASILPFWVWRYPIHGRDCLARSGVYNHAIFCPVIRTIFLNHLTAVFNSDR